MMGEMSPRNDPHPEGAALGGRLEGWLQTRQLVRGVLESLASTEHSDLFYKGVTP
jgi:hypothetical protein